MLGEHLAWASLRNAKGKALPRSTPKEHRKIISRTRLEVASSTLWCTVQMASALGAAGGVGVGHTLSSFRTDRAFTLPRRRGSQETLHSQTSTVMNFAVPFARDSPSSSCCTLQFLPIFPASTANWSTSLRLEISDPPVAAGCLILHHTPFSPWLLALISWVHLSA